MIKLFNIKVYPSTEIQWSKVKKKPSKLYPNSIIINAARGTINNSKNLAYVRQENARILLLKLNKVSGWYPLTAYDDQLTPYLIGMVCSTPLLAKKRFLLFNKRDSLVMKWPDLPLELLDYDSNISENVIDLAEKTIYFFVHQGLNRRIWIKCLNEVLNMKSFE